MKPSLTIVFDSMAGLYEAVDRLRGTGHITQVLTLGEPAEFQPAVKTRKPRSDAGQPRGPYNKSTGENAAGESTPTESRASGGARPFESAARSDAEAASTPTNPAAAPVQEPKSAADGQSVPPAAPAAAELTKEDAHAALKRVSGTPGLGTQTCIGILGAFSVLRLSELPKEKYADFIAHCDRVVAQKQAADAK